METEIVQTKAQVEALDRMVLKGKILEAIDAFFHPDVVTQEGNGAITNGLANKKEKLTEFFAGIASVNAITLHSHASRGDVSMSEYTFDLTRKDGTPILWNEILRRKWKDGLVIDERYYTAD